MKVCLGQINTTPGDFNGNEQRMRNGIDAAVSQGADLLVFPELSVPGYLSQDLIYHPQYIERNLAVCDSLAEYAYEKSPQLSVVVGYIDKNTGPGKPFYNCAALLQKGSVAQSYRKSLLPFYDVFDEGRYYEPDDELAIFDLCGYRVGITICEDLWNDKGSDDYNYSDNPMEHYRAAGVDLMVSLNSSPYVHDKVLQRLEVIGPGTKDMALVYVNQVGGQDELVFDGHSFVMRNGSLLHLESEIYKDSFTVVDLASAKPLVEQPSKSALKKFAIDHSASLFDLLVLGLRDYVQKSGFSELVLASSGGVDSAVVCLLACHAVGPERVHAIRLPSVFSSDHSKLDALALHQNLGCYDYEVPVNHQGVVEFLNERFDVHSNDKRNLVTERLGTGAYAQVADENIQARLRDLYVMHFSNAFGAMPLSTGNKTESACGYYTHFDMNFSYAPIKDLYKYQVVDIAKQHAEVPENIWEKPPSAELAFGQTDEANLLPYSVLDAIVRSYVEEYVTGFGGFADWVQQRLTAGIKISGDHDTLQQWLDQSGSDVDYDRIVSLIGRMEFKRRQTCPGTKVSKVAFGIGRRIPIVERWS